jgi:hypothetical protein
MQSHFAFQNNLRYVRFDLRDYTARMSRLRRLVVSDQWFFITCRLLPRRRILSESEFAFGAKYLYSVFPRSTPPPSRLSEPAVWAKNLHFVFPPR